MPENPVAASPAATSMAQAEALAQKLLIIDTHVDVPYRLQREYVDISQRTAGGDFDYVRAKKGGLNAPFMSIYTPADLQGTGQSKVLADKLIDMVEEFTTKWPDKFAIATSVAQVREQFSKGLVSLPLGMENGAPIEGDMANLKHFYDRGIRYITLTHGRNNHICDSSYDSERKWHGLSPFGREVVAEMNRMGIMIDVSHISDDTFFQVMELSKVPVIASHSSCRKFTPGFERNMSDEMIKLLAEKDGVIMINFGSSFISESVRQQRTAAREHVVAHVAEQGWAEDSEEAKAYRRDYYKANTQYADIADVVAHFKHVIDLVGIDHVGFGSDYDGVGDSLPTGLKDAAAFPNLINEFLKLGYSEADIEKICSGNIIRVWSKVEAFASKASED